MKHGRVKPVIKFEGGDRRGLMAKISFGTLVQEENNYGGWVSVKLKKGINLLKL